MIDAFVSLNFGLQEFCMVTELKNKVFEKVIAYVFVLLKVQENVMKFCFGFLHIGW
jgi:hypothetical protein